MNRELFQTLRMLDGVVEQLQVELAAIRSEWPVSAERPAAAPARGGTEFLRAYA